MLHQLHGQRDFCRRGDHAQGLRHRRERHLVAQPDVISVDLAGDRCVDWSPAARPRRRRGSGAWPSICGSGDNICRTSLRLRPHVHAGGGEHAQAGLEGRSPGWSTPAGCWRRSTGWSSTRTRSARPAPARGRAAAVSAWVRLRALRQHLADRHPDVARRRYTFRPLSRCASTAATTSPSTPMPAVNTAQRSPQSIRPIRRHVRRCGGVRSSRSTSWLVASIGSGLMPSDRANTLAEPPGTTPTAGTCAQRQRPGPPQQAVDHLVHRAVAAVHDDHVDAVARRPAGRSRWRGRGGRCARRSARTRLSSAWASRSRPAGVVDVAFGLTISTARTRPEPIEAGATGKPGEWVGQSTKTPSR